MANGYDHLEVVVDDMSRVACVAHVPGESGTSAARALLDAAGLFAECGVRIERVLTDNGKAERFIKTLLAEWAYAQLCRSNAERLAALPRWVHFYNHGRPHTSLDGQVPMTALINNVRGNHTQSRPRHGRTPGNGPGQAQGQGLPVSTGDPRDR